MSGINLGAPRATRPMTMTSFQASSSTASQASAQGPVADGEETVPQRMARLTETLTRLNEEKVRCGVQLEQKTSELAAFSESLTAQYGTNDPEKLHELYREGVAQNLARLEEAEEATRKVLAQRDALAS